VLSWLAPAARLDRPGRHRPIRRGGRAQPAKAKPAVGDGDDDQDDDEQRRVASSPEMRCGGRQVEDQHAGVPLRCPGAVLASAL